MASSRIPVEIVRFSLLLVLTVGLVSVATRYDDNGGSSRSAHRSGASASPSGAPSAPGTGSSSGGTAQPSSSPGGGSDGTEQPASGGDGGSVQAAGAGGAGGGGVDELPRTGPDQAARLAALAFVLIGTGSLTVVTTGPGPAWRTRRRR